MPEVIFSSLIESEKKFLLDSLGYGLNKEGFIINNKTKKIHKCPITKENVRLSDASILPGSTIIINTNALTLSEYFSRYLKSNGG